MTFRAYVLFMLSGTLIAWIGWLLVIFNTDPFESGPSAFILFYLTLFMGLVGMFTLLGLGYRTLVAKRREILGREVRISFRHGLFLAWIAVISLALSAVSLLHWWAFMLLVAMCLIIEYLFLVKEGARRN